MQTLTLNRKNLQIGVMICALVMANIVLIARAHAASVMTHATVTEYNMNASTGSQLTVAFTAGAADGAGTLTANFGSWGGTVNTTQPVSTTGCQAMTGATNTLPGAITAAGAGQIVTVSSVGALTSGQSYCFNLTSATAVTNPVAGVYPVVLTDGTDTVTTGIDVIANDQVVVSATVPPTFTMSLSSNADTFGGSGNLSSTALTTSNGVTATISTNGNYGWFLWAMDNNAGLRSPSQSKTISTVATGSNVTMNGAKLGTEAYALGVTTANATANYADAGGITGSGLSTTAYNQIASGNAAVSGATATVKELADISATTPAATDYSDTVSLVGAGSF